MVFHTPNFSSSKTFHNHFTCTSYLWHFIPFQMLNHAIPEYNNIPFFPFFPTVWISINKFFIISFSILEAKLLYYAAHINISRRGKHAKLLTFWSYLVSKFSKTDWFQRFTFSSYSHCVKHTRIRENAGQWKTLCLLFYAVSVFANFTN